MATKSKSLQELHAILNEESKYARYAAEWVTRYNASPESGIPLMIGGTRHPLTNADQITAVTFAVVGAYAYSEDTWDIGGMGLKYTFWEKRKSSRMAMDRYYACPLEIRWYGDMSAGKFIEECVALMEAGR